MWFRRKNWQSSDAHLLLLSEFCKGDTPDRYVNSEVWELALGEKPEKAIRRLVDDSMLQLASLHRVLDYNFTATELKEILREKGLKVSGPKAEIVSRLIEDDTSGMRSLVKTANVYECTSQGAELVRKYLDEERERRLLVERETLSFLSKGEFRNAVSVMSKFEASQVFPRGVGIDWKKYDSERKVKSLKTVFDTPPEMLDGLTSTRLEALQIAAGMSELWGIGDAKRWLPADFQTGIRIGPDVAARMLCFHAAHVTRMEAFKESVDFVIGAEISAIGDGRTCEECIRISQTKYKLSEVPALPFSKCSSEMGCRCLVVPITAIDQQ